MKARTKAFAVDSIKFCDTLKKCKASDVITYQFVKSATSTGANYRAACKGRSKKEFYSKMCIVAEEADESQYWLEIIKECELSSQIVELENLLKESDELSRIMTSAKTTAARSF